MLVKIIIKYEKKLSIKFYDKEKKINEREKYEIN